MNMYTWGIASAGFLATVLLFMILFREKWRDGWHLSGLQLFTAGLYGAILILLLPIKFDEAVWQDMPLMLWLRALLLSVPEGHLCWRVTLQRWKKCCLRMDLWHPWRFVPMGHVFISLHR